jgi:serine phosphatase RsbU (regulator of sigma subunit)
MLGLTFLHEIVNKDGIVQANEILHRLRSYIIRALSAKDDQSETRDGMDLSLVVFDPEKQGLEFAGAYNPVVLVREGELIVYKGDKMPIGTHFGEAGPFTNHRIELKNRDMVYMFSDGFQDQFGGEKGSKYKSKHLYNFLRTIGTETVEVQLSRLEQEFVNWKGSEEQVDDVLVIGIRFNSNNT